VDLIKLLSRFSPSACAVGSNTSKGLTALFCRLRIRYRLAPLLKGHGSPAKIIRNPDVLLCMRVNLVLRSIMRRLPKSKTHPTTDSPLKPRPPPRWRATIFQSCATAKLRSKNANNSATESKCVACADTMCSTRPVYRTAPARNCTTNAWSGESGPCSFGTLAEPFKPVDITCLCHSKVA
jgi:hypothetical protein